METFDEEQRQILEQIATGAPLSDVLVNIVRLVEKRSPGMPCSILLLDRASDTLRHGAAPNLPSEYLRAIDGSKIGATAGSCGAAAYLQRTVIVEDIDSHPNWVDYKHLALPHGLRACWSTPIFSAQHEPLGTFAMYYRKPRGPSGDDKRNVDAATHLAAIAIARERTEHARRDAERRLRESESLLRIASRVARIGAWTLDVSQQAVTWSDEAFAIHELPVGAHPSFSEMIAFYAPEGRNPLRSAIDACARSGVPFDLELPLITAQQRAIWVRVLGQVEPGAAPGRVRLQGALQDITERRKLQAELYQSQKMDAV
ncbi:MAG TPA: GAF domain-containing protein, partial [Polyangiales bacterium]|nr:GAF domain-containing protein [Polyangiales bacterium]